MGADRERPGCDAVHLAVMTERLETGAWEVATSCATCDSAAVVARYGISAQAIVAQALMQ